MVITEGVDEFPIFKAPKFKLEGDTEIRGPHIFVTTAFVFVTEAVLVCGEILVSIPVTFVLMVVAFVLFTVALDVPMALQPRISPLASSFNVTNVQPAEPATMYPLSVVCWIAT